LEKCEHAGVEILTDLGVIEHPEWPVAVDDVPPMQDDEVVLCMIEKSRF